MIMKQDCFDGFSQLLEHQIMSDKSEIGKWCISNENYIVLLSKYYDKNKEWIKYVLENANEKKGIAKHPLVVVSEYPVEKLSRMRQLVKVFLDLSEATNVVIDDTWLGEAAGKCRNIP